MLLGHCKPSFSYNTFIHSYFRYIKASYNYLDYVKQHLLIQGGCDIRAQHILVSKASYFHQTIIVVFDIRPTFPTN